MTDDETLAAPTIVVPRAKPESPALAWSDDLTPEGPEGPTEYTSGEVYANAVAIALSVAALFATVALLLWMWHVGDVWPV